MTPLPCEVGILGGGQLALMLAESLNRLTTDIVVLDAFTESPYSVRREGAIRGWVDEPAALEAFFARARVATYDTENISPEPLVPWAHRLLPSLEILKICQDRIQEKAFINTSGFPTVAYRSVGPGEDLRAAAADFGFPAIAKTARGGYDGLGQHRLRDASDARWLPERPAEAWVLEEVFAIETELSCIVARDSKTTANFPVIENLHQNHILDVSLIPARIAQDIQREALAIANGLARALALRGLLTVEFFWGTGRDGIRKLVVNELAPRVHNSGHLTRQACDLSQFDALSRILVGAPLHAPTVLPGCWGMGQMLGEIWIAQGKSGAALDLRAWAGFPDVVDVYLYGKREARPERKMGHFVVRGNALEVVEAQIHAFRDALRSTR